MKPEFTEAAAGLYQTDQPAFEEIYGNRFVRGVKTGGEFSCFIQISCEDETKKSEFYTNVTSGVSIGVASAEVAVKYAEQVAQYVSTNQLRVFALQIGGAEVPDTAVPITIQEALERFINFPSIVAASPVPYAVDLMPYEMVTGVS